MAKHKHEEHENHERWLVSYADFITLLFAFFVVMYSISAVNEGKFRTVSESIKAALRPVANQPVSSLAFNIGQSRPSLAQPAIPTSKRETIRHLREMVKAMQTGPQFAVIHLAEKENGDIVITIPDQILFNSGEATIRQEALPFLKGLAAAMLELDRYVRIEGHTDNVPIRTAQFPSNWELSAARAVIVVRVLSELYGVPTGHLTAVGHADTRPVAENLTPQERTKNRRVEIIILEKAPPVPVIQSDLGEATGESAMEEAREGLTDQAPIHETSPQPLETKNP